MRGDVGPPPGITANRMENGEFQRLCRILESHSAVCLVVLVLLFFEL